jgi:NAD(P)-dependent dehydrogenase (short-subunit alcohol dehydrogenase family)
VSTALTARRAGVALTFPPGAALVAGSGNIGAAVTRRLAQAGVPVVFTYQKNAERAQSLQREITGQGGDAHALQLDFEDAVDVQRAVVETAERYGRLHTVVYCSGPNIPFLKVREMPAETLAYHFRADTLGCFRLFQHAIPVLEAGGGGSLTACVSMANHRALDTDGLSAIPKAAVESLVRQIAAEEAVNKIRANAVPIGWVGGFASSFEEARAYTDSMTGPEAPATRALMGTIMSWIRMGRPGTGEEAANIVAFLASEQASYVTGCLIPADGGAIL